MRRLALSVLVLALAGAVVVEATATKPQPLQSAVTVVGIQSGDTLDVRLAKTGKQERVHLLGIASPKAGSCFSQQAADATRRLVEGQRLVLTADRVARDRAGNLLAYAALPDGSDLGTQLVAGGLAQIDVWNPPTSRFLSYVPVQQKAEDSSQGMWAACAANIGVTMKGSADPLLIDDRIEYTATITNQGPLTAPNVTIDVRPGSEAAYVSADTPNGKCNTEIWDGTCFFGAVPPGATVTATFLLDVVGPGTLATRATVRFTGCIRSACGSAPLDDSDLTDNHTAVLTTVLDQHAPPPGTPRPKLPPTTNCDPSYPTVCIPPPPPVLHCADLPWRDFPVLHTVPNADPQHLDGDNDGFGCTKDDY